VNRNADLMFRTYLEVTLPDTRLAATGASISGVTASSVPNTSTAGVLWTAGGRRRLGYLLIQQVEIEIGGQIMDRHYGEWMYLWESLTSPYDQSVRLDQMLGANVAGTYSTPAGCNGRPAVLYIPLSFWFCRNPGLALPLIALQYHEVRLNFIFRQATDLVQNIYGYDALGNAQYWPGGINAAAAALPRFKDAAVYVDYIYLDTDERRRFAQQTHEYLIDQLQYGLQQSITSQTVRLDLTLNHPVKELVWVYQDARMLDCSQIGTAFGTVPAAANTQPFQYADIANRCRLQLNGQDRFDERYGDYFWKVQPYQHHSGGAFEVHAYTQPVGQSAVGNPMTVIFNIATSPGIVANTTAGGQTGITLTAAGATYAQIQAAATAYGANPAFTVVSAISASDLVTRILPGTTITFTAANAGTWSAAPTAYTAQIVTVVAVWDAAQTYSDPVSGGSLGFQQQQNSAYTVNQATNAFLPAYTQSINPINMYSFSLAPEEHQPSGSCNFSRIDTTTLVFDSITGADGKALSAGQFPSKQYPYLFRMYAVNYNIFRVMSGMGGLAYSN
jgi:Major capsid protein N-terminus/Large eukaryotic DNA virus major capsid protein